MKVPVCVCVCVCVCARACVCGSGTEEKISWVKAERGENKPATGPTNAFQPLVGVLIYNSRLDGGSQQNDQKLKSLLYYLI